MPNTFFRGAPLLMLALLAGCSGIGDGNSPDRIVIIPREANLAITREQLDTPPADSDVFTCVGGSLAAIVEFKDGDLGDFSTRAVWSTSNPAVVRVSNGDEALPSDPSLFFIGGSLIPVAPGTATVSVNYLGLTGSIEVTVQALDLDTLKFNRDNFTLAPRSFEAVSVRAVLDGEETDITGSASLGFVEENDAVAFFTPGQLGSLATVTALAVGDPLVLRARFNTPCGKEPTANVRVAELQSVLFQYEEGFDQNLVSGTSQFTRVTGNFLDVDGDGTPDTQDLSLQSALASDNTAVINAGGVLTGRNLLLAVTSGTPPALLGTANVTATFGATIDTDGDGPIVALPGIASNPLPFTVYNVRFDPGTLAITPSTPQTIEPRGTTTLKAAASYTFESVTRTQDLTRHVGWTSSVPELLGIVNGLVTTAGTVVSVNGEEGTATVTARLVQGVIDTSTSRPVDDPNDLTATTTVTVDDPAP